MTKGDICMWRCPNCGESNSESSVFCTSCNKRRESIDQATVSVQAFDLQSWARRVWYATIVAAIVTFIVSGFTYTTDVWGELALGFNFLSMLKGIIPAFCMIIAGGMLKAIMNGLAVLVEAANKGKNEK